MRGVPFCESSLSYHFIIESEALEKIVKKKYIVFVSIKKNWQGERPRIFQFFLELPK